MLKVKALQLTAAWIASGDGYDFNVESDKEGSDCGWFSSSTENGRPGTLKQRLSASPYSGNRVKLIGFCRAEKLIPNGMHILSVVVSDLAAKAI